MAKTSIPYALRVLDQVHKELQESGNGLAAEPVVHAREYVRRLFDSSRQLCNRMQVAGFHSLALQQALDALEDADIGPRAGQGGAR